MEKNKLETIGIIETKEEVNEYNLNFAMLLSIINYDLQFGKPNYRIIKVGAYRVKFEVLD